MKTLNLAVKLYQRLKKEISYKHNVASGSIWYLNISVKLYLVTEVKIVYNMSKHVANLQLNIT
jgi:hypothetical protein